MPLVNYEQAARIAELFKPILSEYSRSPDRFDDELFYPSPRSPSEIVALYFLVMVAMDHRLSRPGHPYKAVVDGRELHGADLLYYLGARMLERNPGFFEPQRLVKVTASDVRAWLCVGNICPPDPDIRAALLRDLGTKLLKLYDGNIMTLLKESRGLLHSFNPETPGFVERLRVFEAYGDPVEKKPMLLAKFLERRGLISFEDKHNKRVPVDNHVTRIALRLGLVELEEPLKTKVLKGIATEWWEDVAIRVAVREAWHEVAVRSGYDDFILDDLLWSMGRRVCVRGAPYCMKCKDHPVCVHGVCALRLLCPTGLRVRAAVDEHVFYNIWWY